MVNDVNIQGSLFADEQRRDTVMARKSRREIHEDYDGFVEKFKPRKTTDDCYTPQPVYDAVLGWLRENADIEGREIVRPFWPGGDYEHYDYPDGCVVVDNPPFSIFTQVCRFFQSRNISFFLFAPHLTLFSSKGIDWTCIICNVRVTYENGAHVNTSFASNLFGDIRFLGVYPPSGFRCVGLYPVYLLRTPRTLDRCRQRSFHSARQYVAEIRREELQRSVQGVQPCQRRQYGRVSCRYADEVRPGHYRRTECHQMAGGQVAEICRRTDDSPL